MIASGKMRPFTASPALEADGLERRDAEDDGGHEHHAEDSNRSEAMPAQSPTLSPTLSAMVAGLRGSSSGMPASTLPTRSAPTSAALVKMPPPTRRNRASSEPPKPKPTRMAEAVFWKTMTMTVAPSRPRPAVARPTEPPVRKATLQGAGVVAGGGRGRGADVALGGEPHAEEPDGARGHAAHAWILRRVGGRDGVRGAATGAPFERRSGADHPQRTALRYYAEKPLCKMAQGLAPGSARRQVRCAATSAAASSPVRTAPSM
jgi:hypothetical protein